MPPGLNCPSPGVVSFEDFLEVKKAMEVLPAILILLHKYSAFHHGEDQIPEVIGFVYAPVPKDGSRHGSILLQSQLPYTVGKLFSRDMPRLVQVGQDRVKSGQQKEIGLPMKPRALALEFFQNFFCELRIRHAPNFTFFTTPRQL